MPDSPVLRLFIINWTIGVLLGCAFASAILWFDISGIYRLVALSDSPIAPLALLYGGFSITCGGVVCATAVMHSPNADNSDRNDGLGQHAELVPVRIRIRRR